MSKQLTVVALFAALITTVVTSTLDNSGNPEQSCESEVRQVQMMHCMQWMQSQTTGSSFIRSAVGNQEEHLQQCCDEVTSVSEACRCDAMRHMMKQMRQQYGMEGEMIKEKMQSLPKMCGIKSPTHCRFTVVFV